MSASNAALTLALIGMGVRRKGGVALQTPFLPCRESRSPLPCHLLEFTKPFHSGSLLSSASLHPPALGTTHCFSLALHSLSPRLPTPSIT